MKAVRKAVMKAVIATVMMTEKAIQYEYNMNTT